jgi:hypothetical protein
MECPKCKYKWEPRTKKPKECPRCKARLDYKPITKVQDKEKVNVDEILSELRGKPVEKQISEESEDTIQPPIPVIKTLTTEQKINNWITEKLRQKGYIRKEEDIEEFIMISGIHDRSTFDKYLKRAGLVYDRPTNSWLRM